MLTSTRILYGNITQIFYVCFINFSLLFALSRGRKSIKQTKNTSANATFRATVKLLTRPDFGDTKILLSGRNLFS